jgi:hypothetical protein
MKYLRLMAAIILFCLIPISISGQEQKNIPDILTDKFMKYCNSFPREEIYVHTDRQEYIAGENVWFAVYLFDRRSSKPSSGSRIVYFEILNAENRPVVQKRISLGNASGSGHVNLSDTLSPGYYTLRAYTNWMKNFLPGNCFSKKLAIYNAIGGKDFNRNSNHSASLLIDAEKTKNPSLPESGLTVKINKQNPESVDLIINADRNFRSREGNTCYILVQTHGLINIKRTVDLNDGNIVISLPRNLLIPGINHIALFNASGKPVNEQFIYTPLKETGLIAMTSTDSIYIREKFSIDILIRGATVRSAGSQNLSVSIAPPGENTFPDIGEYMIFGSEFGIIPDEILRSGIDNIQAETLDKYLSSIKSSWINWDAIISDDVPKIKYRKEAENHYIYGRLINKNTQKPDGEQYLFLSMPGKIAAFQYALTDINGEFYFIVPVDDRNRNLIIQPEDVERNNTIRIESSFSNIYPDIGLSPDSILKETPQSMSKLGVNYQVMKIYGSEDVPLKSEPLLFTGGTKRFYGKPDIELLMDDYIKLPVMQEVFFELMPGVFMKKKKTGYEITISDPVENKVYDEPPILLVDGVVIHDPDLIANLDPELVEKIDAVKSRYFVGNYLFYGLVNVITRAGDFSNIPLPDYTVRLPYRVAEASGLFSSSDYSLPENKKRRIPDFRNTMYWNSSVKPDKEGKAEIEFWTSDYKSDYEINIQGIAGDGKLISLRKKVKVK